MTSVWYQLSPNHDNFACVNSTMLHSPMSKTIANHSPTEIRPAANFRQSKFAQPEPWQVEVFHDGECPLCRREIQMLRWMDRRQRIRFTDIAAEDFDPANYGKTLPDFIDEINGRLPDGSWLTGVEVFRRLYSACGLSWLVAPTRLPGVSQVLAWSYRVFARNRLKLTGRCGPGASECKIT